MPFSLGSNEYRNASEIKLTIQFLKFYGLLDIVWKYRVTHTRSESKFCLVCSEELCSKFCKSNDRTWLFRDSLLYPGFGNIRCRVWDSTLYDFATRLFPQPFTSSLYKANLARCSIIFIELCDNDVANNYLRVAAATFLSIDQTIYKI